MTSKMGSEAISAVIVSPPKILRSPHPETAKAGFPFIHAKYGFGTINTEVPVINSFDELTKVVPEVIG